MVCLTLLQKKKKEETKELSQIFPSFLVSKKHTRTRAFERTQTHRTPTRKEKERERKRKRKRDKRRETMNWCVVVCDDRVFFFALQIAFFYKRQRATLLCARENLKNDHALVLCLPPIAMASFSLSSLAGRFQKERERYAYRCYYDARTRARGAHATGSSS